jgi:hypothetical protein
MTTQPFDIRASRRTEGAQALGGTIRVLAVAARAPVRLGLGGLLEVRTDAEQAVTAVSAREARGAVARVAPDAVAVQPRREGVDDPFEGGSAEHLPSARMSSEPAGQCS